jgi:hypothetical protein
MDTNNDNDIFARAEARIRSLGFSDDATKRKLEEYAVLREKNPSSLTIVNIAEDLMTSFIWVVTGERDPYELRSTARNVLCGPENDEPGAEWLVAKNVFSDVLTAYEQVKLAPSDNFEWTGPKKTAYADAKISQLGEKAGELSFFDFIEECFGVDIVVLDRPENFTAIGATIGGSPLIVVKQGLDAATGHEAVARELGNIMAGNLYWYSDVYENGADSESWIRDFLWVLGFKSNLLNLVSKDALAKNDTYAHRRFPERLVEAHRRDVAAKKNLGYFLEWMEK